MATTSEKNNFQPVSRHALAYPCETSGCGVVTETKLNRLVQKLADIKSKVGAAGGRFSTLFHRIVSADPLLALAKGKSGHHVCMLLQFYEVGSQLSPNRRTAC